MSSITLADYRALPTCKRCGARVVPFHDLTPEHAHLAVRALGSPGSGLCAPCWKAATDAGEDPDYRPARERTPFGQFQLRRSHLITSKPGARFRETPTSAPRQHLPRYEPPRTEVPPRTANDGQSWAERWEGALCAQADPEAWFPDKGESAREAKAICAVCPLREACLEYALDNGLHYGIFGGLSERERRGLRKPERGYNSVARSA